MTNKQIASLFFPPKCEILIATIQSFKNYFYYYYYY